MTGERLEKRAPRPEPACALTDDERSDLAGEGGLRLDPMAFEPALDLPYHLRVAQTTFVERGDEMDVPPENGVATTHPRIFVETRTDPVKNPGIARARVPAPPLVRFPQLSP